MSNLYKYSTVVCPKDEKKVIDSNAIISEKIVKIKEAFENEHHKDKQNEPISGDNFSLGLNAEHVEELLNEEYDSNENLSEDERKAVLKTADDIIENAQKEAEQIIEKAKKQAEEILKEGEEKVKLISMDAADEGRRSGYEEGIRNGEEEIAERQKELEKYKEKLDKEYDDRIKRMEPELVDVLLKIFSEVTKVLAVDKRDLILTLVNSVMSGTEVSKNYIIKTNKDDAQFLRDNKDRIQGVVGRNINIEIVEDPMLKRNQCLIDTDLGIFDCSLDIQLENLIDDIKILACSDVDYFKEK